MPTHRRELLRATRPFPPMRPSAAPILMRLGRQPRRIAAAICLLLAIGFAIVPRHQSPVVTVVVTAHDLSAGAWLAATDLATTQWPQAHAPPQFAHTIEDLIGRRINAPMSGGEVVTPIRLLDRSVAAGLSAGASAMTLTLSDAAQATIVQVGDTVDVYASNSGIESTTTPPETVGAIAKGVHVLAVLGSTVTGARTGQSTNRSGLLDNTVSIVIAVDQATATRLAQRSPGPFLATLRPLS